MKKAPAIFSPRGSSPLTRGKRPHARRDRPNAGLIPAHAGKTLEDISGECRVEAHPRSRGENRVADLHTRLAEGSSPLTRGKPGIQPGDSGPGRLIPAHAGKTTGPVPAQPVFRAHPRSRGENEQAIRAGDIVCGSSPLTRGKPPPPASPAATPGLIPAHAGKTSVGGLDATRCRAHPRSRGENASFRRETAFVSGSSPLTRGKLPGKQGLHLRPRLIPAHAGKTCP